MSVRWLAKDGNSYFRRSSEKKFDRSNEFTCEICKKEFSDPRVLPCLHSFCIDCLRKLDSEQNSRATSGKESRLSRVQGISGGHSSGRYEYVKLDTFSQTRSRSKDGSLQRKSLEPGEIVHPRLKCPICGFENKLPPKGTQDLPPHYLLQHRMLINSLNRKEICLLCDLCSSETPAVCRCTKCLLNLCDRCSESHKRKKLFPDHELKKLNRNHQEGTGITRIRRQVMCPVHVEKELRFYCSSCNMVACTECCVEYHSDHDCESFSRAAQMYTHKIKEALEKTRLLNRDTSAEIVRLNQISRQIEKDINNHVDSYLDAYEEHRKTLLNQAAEIKKGQINGLKLRQMEVEKKSQDIGQTLRFGEELLTEGSDFEVLSLAFYLLQRLEWCIKSGSSALSSAFTSCMGTLQFLPDERAGSAKNKPIFGIVTTQIVSPSNSYITPEGLDALRNCQENQRCDLMLVTKDSYGQRLTHGVEGIEIELRCQNGSRRQIPIYMVDQQNGSYLISFTPDISGKMCLSASIRGVPIKGSPFSVRVRSRKVQKETFCSFCSSGKKKNSVCGCGSGRNSAGYRGCGRSPPDEHQWPCCGNTLKRSECLRSLGNSGFYELSL